MLSVNNHEELLTVPYECKKATELHDKYALANVVWLGRGYA
jgi:hypothetical protein